MNITLTQDWQHMLYPTHRSYRGIALILLNFISAYMIQLVTLINLAPCYSTDAAKNSLRREVEILKSKPHWSKAYFYLWDEVHYFTFSAMLVMVSSLHITYNQ